MVGLVSSYTLALTGAYHDNKLYISFGFESVLLA